MKKIAMEFAAGDVSDAIAQAARHFNLPQTELKIEILDTGSTGIFGFRRKKAKIRATPHTDARPATTTAGTPGREEKTKKSRPRAERPEAKKKETPLPQVVQDDGDEMEPLPEIVKLDQAGLDAVQEETVRLVGLMELDAGVTVCQEEAALVNITGPDAELLVGPDGRTLDSFQYLLRKIVTRRLDTKAAIDVNAAGFREKRADNLRRQALELARTAIDSGETQALSYLNPQERRIVHVCLRDETEIRTRSVGSGLFKKVLIFRPDRRPESKPRRKTEENKTPRQ